MATKTYFKSLNEILTVQIDKEERLVTEIKTAMTELNEDSGFIVKNKPIQLFLDSMLEIDLVRKERIEKLQETDTIINLKAKALNFLKSQIKFDENGLQEYRKAFQEISTPLNEMVNNNQQILDGAKRAFAEVYNIPQDDETTTPYNYVELAAFKYKKANILYGEEVSVLSFSGDTCYNSIVYFNQFIVKVKSTGDIIRILSPCQSYDATDTGTTVFSPANTDYPNPICLIVFNKDENSLERKNLKTIIGSVGFIKN